MCRGGCGNSEFSELISVGGLEILQIGVLFLKTLGKVEKGPPISLGQFDVDFAKLLQFLQSLVGLDGALLLLANLEADVGDGSGQLGGRKLRKFVVVARHLGQVLEHYLDGVLVLDA